MKTQKGITLIALIITIIVMLILVGVSVSVALNTGLFTTAQGVAKNTEEARDEETAISNGAITVKVGDEEKTYDSIDKYIESLKEGEGEEGIKVAETPTHKLVLPKGEETVVFLIDANTTFADLIDIDEGFTVETWQEGEAEPEVNYVLYNNNGWVAYLMYNRL